MKKNGKDLLLYSVEKETCLFSPHFCQTYGETPDSQLSLSEEETFIDKHE